MGEIATWSAVKTKVGLGKDSNECPTKAELLALSPTGSGESYIGLELSNPTSYGDNETVQLSDIHKVTYKYVFTPENDNLSFPAAGGPGTPPIINLTSNKTKYLDGVATSEVIGVGRREPVYPSWLSYSTDLGRLVAQENTTTESRTETITYVQNESGKVVVVTVTQAAGTETWEYTFTAQYDALGFPALGGTPTPIAANVTSTKQKYINGVASGNPISVSYTVGDLPDWAYIEEGQGYRTYENKTESSRSTTNTLTQAESGKKLNITLAQLAGVKTYGTPTVYLGSIADIPASGGTAATPTYTYAQLWGWNGKTDDGGTIDTGASVVWSDNISGSNLGTTAKARTKLGSRTLTVTLNGKSGSASIDVYQAENKIERVTQGAWVVSISANPSSFTEQGGTSTISSSATASRTNHWTSGATNAAANATATPVLSIPTPVTGFSLSGNILTVAANATANDRSVVVRATVDSVYKEVTVTQSAYLLEWEYTFTASPTTLSFDALGTSKNVTITSYREKYINGSLVEGSREAVQVSTKSSTSNIKVVTDSYITMYENTTTQARTGTVVYEQVGSGKTQTITCNQAAGTVTTRDVLEVTTPLNSTNPATGEADYAIVKSGYYDVINGKDTTWHNVAPTLKSKSSYITSVDITKSSGDGYKVSIDLSENTSESSRRATLTLGYGTEEVTLSTTQSGASVSYNYYLAVTQDFSSISALGGTATAVIKSRKYKVINGVEQSSYSHAGVTLVSKPSWTGDIFMKTSSSTLPGADLDVTIPVYENTSGSRSGTLVLQQGDSVKQITLNLSQEGATITQEDFIDYDEGEPTSWLPDGRAQGISVNIVSYRRTLINGKESTKTPVVPTWDISGDDGGSWLHAEIISTTGSTYMVEVTVDENPTISTRNGDILFKNGTAEVENLYHVTQDGATLSYNYYIGFNGNPDVGGYSMNWDYTQQGSQVGQSVDLKCWRKKVLNGVETDEVEAAEYEAIFKGDDIDSFTVTNTDLSYDPGTLTVRAFPKSMNSTVFARTGTVEYRIADYPSKSAYLYLTHNPVATQKRWTFQWSDQVESVTMNVTMKNLTHDASAGSISPITIISKLEYLLASNLSVVAYTEYPEPVLDEDAATPVSWGRLLKNGQTAQNYYDYAYILEENTEENDRYATLRFSQPDNPSDKKLYCYIEQKKIR